ncbi:hypothetical protein ACWELX_13725, partial [Streptomyces tendae]
MTDTLTPRHRPARPSAPTGTDRRCPASATRPVRQAPRADRPAAAPRPDTGNPATTDTPAPRHRPARP